MILFYIVLVIGAASGIGFLVYRHKDGVFQAAQEGAEEVPTFALFMDGISVHMSGLWNDYAKVQIFSLLEKNLRKVRIVTLRVEHFLFRMTHRVKDIADRAEEVKAENTAEAASQNEPPSVQ